MKALRLVTDAEGSELEACRRGDRKAIESVLRAHAPVLLRLIRRLVGPTADLEDLLHVVFVEAISGFARFRGEASVKSWLCQIAVHVCHDHLHSPARRRLVGLEETAADREPVDPGKLPDREAEDRQLSLRLAAHLDSLPPKRRIAFVLHVVEGYPLAEVAVMVGATVMATKSRVFWARRALLSRLEADPTLRDWVKELSR